MKVNYQNLLPVRLMKNYVLSVFFLGIYWIANAQIYRTSLSGTSESPPNNSMGIGTATVTILDTLMRVQTVFSGLVGLSTAAHIHAATAVPGEGNTGVATTTPSFPGFPVSVTSGSYDMTFDMTLASSYNASYITSNGGTTASAFAALKTALNNGTAYFNLHSSMYPGGEIRGFFRIISYEIVSSMSKFHDLPEAISNAMPGDHIQQIGDAVETAPLELPPGFIFSFQSPYTLNVTIP